MTCNVKRDSDGNFAGVECGPEPKPADHGCDIKGPFVELETGMGTVNTATCSICGRAAFQFHDIW